MFSHTINNNLTLNRSKLLDLLRTFSNAEFIDFGKFIHSPLHNESLLMIRLYNSLKKFYPEFNSIKLTKENIYCDVYGNVKYDDKKLRDRLSDMHNLSEDYLSWLDYRKDPVKIKRHTLNQFMYRSLETDFNKKFREIQDMIDRTKVKNEYYFYSLHEQLIDKRTFYETRPLPGKRKPFYDDLSAEIDHFTLFFVTKMLIYYTLMLNRGAVLKYDFEYRMYEPIINFIEENNFDKYPLIKSYYLTLKLNKEDGSEKIYFELKKYLIKNADLIEAEDKKLIFTELSNYALKKAYKEKPEFKKERFDLMNLQLKQKTYPDENEGWMDLGFFQNYVIESAEAGKLDLTGKFLEEYSLKLNPDKRENVCAFSKGLLHYSQKKYYSALDDLSGIRGVDFGLYIRVRTLLSKIYFDMNDYENVLTLIDSFKHYLSSNPVIPDLMVRKYSNFMNKLKKLTLISLRPEIDDYNCHKLLKEINGCSIEEITSNKYWLLERVNKLIIKKRKK